MNYRHWKSHLTSLSLKKSFDFVVIGFAVIKKVIGVIGFAVIGNIRLRTGLGLDLI